MSQRARRPRRIPKRPYRDSAILYGVLAVAVVLFSAVTGGDLVRAVLVAIGFFVLLWFVWH